VTIKRRSFLKGTLAGGVLAVAAGTGLLKPTRVLAAAWPKSAFDAKTEVDAVKSLFGTSNATASTAVHIKAPIQAENGSVVPVGVKADMDGVESIAIVVQNNPDPLATNVDLSGGAGLLQHPYQDGQDLQGDCLCQGRRQTAHRVQDR